jgi:glycosyltransferase involved in cell wall biosynthesis
MCHPLFPGHDQSTLASRIFEILTMHSHTLPVIALSQISSAPKVSVLITSYNYGRFIGNAIDSVLTQSYLPCEIIVADDGSTDDSCEIVEAFAHAGKPVKLVREKHQGMAACMNAAFNLASGDIICLLDADDYFLPGKIEAVVSAFHSKPDAGFAIHRAQMIDPFGRKRGVYPLLSSLPQGNCAAATLSNAGILMGLPPTSNLSLRYEIARRIFPLPSRFSGYAEQVIHRMAPLMTSICSIDRTLSVWRLHHHNDGNSGYVAVERLERELGYMRDLWLQQREYLLERNPDFAASMPTLEKSPFYMKMQYMRHKLRNDPATRGYHKAMCALAKSNSSVTDLFWQHSIYLPRPVFQRCIDLLQTQSIWKEWLAKGARWLHT